jgi:YCII-related domain
VSLRIYFAAERRRRPRSKCRRRCKNGWRGSRTLERKATSRTRDIHSSTREKLSGKQKAVSDGPYAEAKDVVGGYIVVEASDLNQAVELSIGCPILEVGGSVEVRPNQKINS